MLRGSTRHHNSDCQKRQRALALRHSIGVIWNRVPFWIPGWPQEVVREPARVVKRQNR